MKLCFPCLWLVCFVVEVCLGADILGVFPVPSHSHQIVYNKVMLALHARGHHITVITPYPLVHPPPNYTQVDISRLSQSYWKGKIDEMQQEGLNRQTPYDIVRNFLIIFNELTDLQLAEPVVQNFINSSHHFDLVIFEWLVTPSFYGLMCKFPAPVVGISSLGMMLHGHDSIGNPSNPAYLPDIIHTNLDTMNFLERLDTTIYAVWYRYKYYYRYLPRQDAISKKYFGEDCEYVGNIEQNVSLLLANTHFTWSFPRPNLPNMIEFGGATPHLPDKKPLPKDIQEFLDSAKDGVIYFSLGSNVKSSTMPESKRALFLDAFRQMKQKVLWKWETDDLPGKPDNVKLGKWLPQTDILAHPNVKGFITQGGLQSMGEATHYNVPMVVIPFFADQELNAKKLVSVGVAIRLDFETITTQDILESLNQIVYHPDYKHNVKKYAELTRDQPQNPMERAVWWTEYVIRHKGARHLRSPVVDMPWYQYFLLDVIAFLFVVSVVSTYISYIVLRAIVRKIFFKSKKSKKE